MLLALRPLRPLTLEIALHIEAAHCAHWSLAPTVLAAAARVNVCACSCCQCSSTESARSTAQNLYRENFSKKKISHSLKSLCSVSFVIRYVWTW